MKTTPIISPPTKRDADQPNTRTLYIPTIKDFLFAGAIYFHHFPSPNRKELIDLLKSMDDSQVRSELPKRISLPKSPEASQPTSEVSDADDRGDAGFWKMPLGKIATRNEKIYILKLDEVSKCNGRDEIEKLFFFPQCVGRESLNNVRKVC